MNRLDLDNLKVLSNYQKGDVLFAKDNKLEIKKLNGFHKFIYQFKKTKNENEVKNVITNVVQGIKFDKNLSELKEQFAEMKIRLKDAPESEKELLQGEIGKLEDDIFQLQKQKADIEKLFYSSMSQLSTNIFDRRVIDPSVVRELNPALQTFKKKKAELLSQKETLQDAEEGRIFERRIALNQMERRIEKVRFAQKLGVPLKPIGEGMSGSYFARDYKMKIKGVFKPKEEESLTGNNPTIAERVKKILYLFLPVNPTAAFHPQGGYLSEALTTTLANHLHFHTVPASSVVTLSTNSSKEAKGSFQVFAKNTTSAQEALDEVGDENLMSDLRQEELEELAVVDFLIFNRDRHEGNWLISTKKAATDGKRNIYLIDHGLSFPKKNPSAKDYLYKRNQFKWASLSFTKQKFSDEMIARLKERLSEPNVNALVLNMRSTSPQFSKTDNEGFSQEQAFLQRVDVLRIFLNKNLPISELAKIKTQEDIDQFLSENGRQ